MTCTITGILRDPAGAALPGAAVVVDAPGIAAQPDGALLPVVLRTQADSAGLLVLSLLPGSYRMRWIDRGRTFQARLGVPDLPAAALSDVLGIGAGAVPQVGALIPPGDPGQVVGYDADGKPAAIDMAAASFPPGAPGQVVGYGAGGTPQAVDLPAASGDMLAAVYDPMGVAGDAFDMDEMRETASAKVMTGAERSKLAGIEAGAQVNAVVSVNGKTGAVVLGASDVGARPAGSVPWAEVSGKPAIIAAGATAAAARTAIDAVADSDARLSDARAPTAHTHAMDDVTGLAGALAAKADAASLGAVATSNAYGDLDGLPAIPAAQVPADWSAVSGPAQILNKPVLGTAAAADAGDFASAAQGAKADTAVQPEALGDLAAKDKVAVSDITATGTPGSGTYLRGDGAWSAPAGGGGGDMMQATYDPGGKAADAFSMGNMVETADAKVMTGAERTRLSGVEAGAQKNVQADWSAVSGDAYIQNKPTLFSGAWGDLTGKPAVIAAGATQGAARSAIGAGTSSLAIGSGAGDAKAGDWLPAWGDVSGKPADFPPAAHSHAWGDITGKPAVIGAGATQADARAAIGAGTSDLTLGGTSSTAKAGNWMPGWTDVTGKPAVIAAGSTQSAARSAIGLGSAAVADSGDFATAAQGALASGALPSTSIATLGEFASATAGKTLGTGSVWGSLVELTDAATITVDLNGGFDFGGASNGKLSLGGNRTLGSPSNGRTGKKGLLWFGASGATRTLTLHADWKLAAGVEAGPYEIETTATLGVAYACLGATVIVTGIVRF